MINNLNRKIKVIIYKNKIGNRKYVGNNCKREYSISGNKKLYSFNNREKKQGNFSALLRSNKKLTYPSPECSITKTINNVLLRLFTNIKCLSPFPLIRKTFEIETQNYNVVDYIGNTIKGNIEVNSSKCCYFCISKQAIHGNVFINKYTGNWVYKNTCTSPCRDFFEVVVWNDRGGFGRTIVDISIKSRISVENEFVYNIQDSRIKGKVNVIEQFSNITSKTNSITYRIIKAPPVNIGTVNIDEHTGDWEFIPVSKFIGVTSFKVGISDAIYEEVIDINMYVHPADVYANNGPRVRISPYRLICKVSETFVFNLEAESIHGNYPLTYSIDNLDHSMGSITNIQYKDIDKTKLSFNYTAKKTGGSDQVCIYVEDIVGYSSRIFIPVTIMPVIYPLSSTDIIISENDHTKGYFDVRLPEGVCYSFINGMKFTTEKGGTVLINKTGLSESLGNSFSWDYIPVRNKEYEDNFDIVIRDSNKDKYSIGIKVNVTNGLIIDGYSPKPFVVITNSSKKGQVIVKTANINDLTFSIKNHPKFGEAVIDTSSGEFTYYSKSSTAVSDNFTIKVSDSKTTNYINIIADVKDCSVCPVITCYSPEVLSTRKKGVISGRVNVEYSSPKLLYTTVTKQANFGTVLVPIDTSQEFKYTPNIDYVGKDKFELTVSDETNSDSICVETTILDTSMTPVVIGHNPEKIETFENTTISGSFKIDNPEKGGKLHYNIFTYPLHGNLIIDDIGNWTYTPDAAYSGMDEFQIEISNSYGSINSLVVIGVLNRSNPYEE